MFKFFLVLVIVFFPIFSKAESSRFEKVWTFEYSTLVTSYMVAESNTVQSKPREYKDLFLFVDHDGHILALNKNSGSLVYKTKLGSVAGRRGFAINEELGEIVIVAGSILYIIDAVSGQILKKTKTNYSVVEPILTSKCIINFGARNGIIECHNKGLDKVLWRTQLGKTARIWSNPLFSEKHNLIYFVTSNPGKLTNIYREEDTYSSSLIGINAQDGSIKFHRQMIKDDLWDYDGVGKPVLIENFLNNDGEIYDLIVGLNKTGTVFALNAVDGSPIKKNQFKEKLFNYDFTKITNVSKTQTIPSWPSRVSNISLMPQDLRTNQIPKNILRHSKFGEFIPPSLDYDVVMKGLHGGPQWFGFKHFRYYGEDFIVVPYNNYSWILRLKYTEKFSEAERIIPILKFIYLNYKKVRNLFTFDKPIENNTPFSQWNLNRWSDDRRSSLVRDDLYRLIKWNAFNEIYDKKCASCHRNDRTGRYQSELWGDGHFPSLVGYTLTEKYKYSKDYSKFMSLHNSSLNIDREELEKIFSFYDNYDKNQYKKGNLEVEGYWQLLLGKDKLPLNKSPWGGLAIINLNTGQKIKDIKVGEMKDKDGNIFKGSIIFGGISETNSKGETLLVGTVDTKAYLVSLPSGEIIETINLVRPGSVQPHLTTINGCDAWVILETGGRFSFYDKSLNGYTIETFIDNSSCN